VRRIWCDTRTAEYARQALTFPGLRVVLRVDRHTRAPDGTRTSQTRYFATSLDPATVSAAHVLRLIRGHWCVENNLHYEKDRWWDEDRHSCRRTGLAERFTTLLSAVISALQVLKPGGPDEPLKAQADALNWDIDQAVKLLTE
jgi:hypothetical protein